MTRLACLHCQKTECFWYQRNIIRNSQQATTIHLRLKFVLTTVPPSDHDSNANASDLNTTDPSTDTKSNPIPVVDSKGGMLCFLLPFTL
ncbi:hypothetical protein MBANPS3_012332 [Mucor bainieri]